MSYRIFNRTENDWQTDAPMTRTECEAELEFWGAAAEGLEIHPWGTEFPAAPAKTAARLSDVGVSKKKLTNRVRGDLYRNESLMTEEEAAYRREMLDLLKQDRAYTRSEMEQLLDGLMTSMDEFHADFEDDRPSVVALNADKRIAEAQRAARRLDEVLPA